MNHVASAIVVALGLIPFALAAEQVTAPQPSDVSAPVSRSAVTGAEKPKNLAREGQTESEPVFPESRCEAPAE